MPWNLINLKPCTCSPVRVEGFWPISSLDIDPLELSKSKNIPEKYCYNGSLTESYLDSLFGMTSQSSDTTIPIAEDISSDCEESEESFALVVDSHAKTFHAPEKELELVGPGADCGENTPESFVKYDQLTHSWKTRQCSLLEGLDEFSGTWPKWGIMQDGECSELMNVEEIITGLESGSLPTPTKCDGKGASTNSKKCNPDDLSYLRYFLHYHFGRQSATTTYPHPLFSEGMMDFPKGWTDLRPLEIHNAQSWRQQHGKF